MHVRRYIYAGRGSDIVEWVLLEWDPLSRRRYAAEVGFVTTITMSVPITNGSVFTRYTVKCFDTVEV